MLREEEIDALVGRIVARVQPQKVIMFGSYAKGTATARSDLDLLVVKDTEMPIARRTDELRPLLSRSLIAVDVHVYTPEEVAEYGREPLAFINSVLRTGRTLFEREEV